MKKKLKKIFILAIQVNITVYTLYLVESFFL